MIIDAHVHLGNSVAMYIYKDGARERIEYMDKTGCDYAIQSFCGGALNVHIDMKAHGAYVERSKKLYEDTRGRIMTYLVYDPRMPEYCVKTIAENYSDPAFAGIKIHPSAHWTAGDDEGYRPVWEAAAKYDLPLLAHTWALTSNPKQAFATPDKFEKYLKEYPETKFIFGHSGGRISGIREATALGKKYKNSYFDIAGDIYDRGLVKYLVSQVGADRIMLASDANWFEVTPAMGMVIGADITENEKKLILGGTAAKLFKIA